MDSIQVKLFGGANLSIDGHQVDLDTRKAMALLAYLLITGRPHHRDALSTFFWPEADQISARGALRRTLSSLRKAIGKSNIVSNRETISLLSSNSTTCDATQFRQILEKVKGHSHPQKELCSACLNDLIQAITLYQGDFLSGFGLRDSLAFDDWQFQESEQFRRDLADVLIMLIDANTNLYDYEQALKYARRWLSLDVLNETAHRKLMLLYAMSGQREAALRQYRECMRILENEIGVPPLEETTLLYDQIKLDRLAFPKKSQVLSQSAGLNQVVVLLEKTDDDGSSINQFRTGPVYFPLVGRENELRTLVNVYENIKENGFFAVLSGEAGIGKTRLADEFIKRIKIKEGSILSARCYESEQGLSLMPISALIRSGLSNLSQSMWWKLLSGYTLGEAARLVPEIASFNADRFPWQSFEGPGAQTRFYDGVVQTLLALAAQNGSKNPSENDSPGLIFLDDMQWADKPSIDILNLILHRLNERKIMILVAWQDIENESTRNLNSITARILREDLGAIFHLKRLNETQVRNLILYTETIGNSLDPALSARITQESEGNPFYLTAYLQARLNEPIVGELNHYTIPETIVEMVRSRMVNVSPAGRQLLQTAAVIGRSFDFQTLHEASGRAEDETVFALEELVAHGLVNEFKDDAPQTIRYDFNHDKIRWIVYQDISLARLRLLNRRIAESLEQQQHGHLFIQTEHLAGRIANHYRQAGETEKAAFYYRQAGDFARKVFANHEALVNFETALALGYQPKKDLYLSIGDIQVLNGDYHAAIQSFETAASQEDVDPLSSSLAFAEWKIGLVYDRLGEWDQAQAQFSAAEKKLPLSALVDRSQLLSDWSLTCHHRGDSQTAEKLAEEALLLASQAGDLQALARIHNLLGILARSKGNLVDAKKHIEQSMVMADLSGLPEIRVAAMNNLARQYQESGEINAATELATQALSICKSIGDRHHEAAIHNHLADLYQSIGWGNEALEQLKLAVAIFAEIGEEAGQWWPEVWKLMEW